jgi:hypothetical protein
MKRKPATAPPASQKLTVAERTAHGNWAVGQRADDTRMVLEDIEEAAVYSEALRDVYLAMDVGVCIDCGANLTVEPERELELLPPPPQRTCAKPHALNRRAAGQDAPRAESADRREALRRAGKRRGARSRRRGEARESAIVPLRQASA